MKNYLMPTFAYLVMGAIIMTDFAVTEEKCGRHVSIANGGVVMVLWLPMFTGMMIEQAFDSRSFGPYKCGEKK